MPYRTNARSGRGERRGHKAGSFASAFAASSTATQQNAVGRGGGRERGRGREAVAGAQTMRGQALSWRLCHEPLQLQEYFLAMHSANFGILNRDTLSQCRIHFEM